MAEVTILVPVFNGEKTLNKTIESIRGQDADYEAILINNGSKDKTDSIIRETVNGDRTHFKGMKFNSTMTMGNIIRTIMPNVATRYVMFAKQADTFEKDGVKTLLDLAKISGAQLTIGSVLYTSENTTIKEYSAMYPTDQIHLKSNTVYNKGTKEREDLYFMDPSAEGKLYSRNLIAGIGYPRDADKIDIMSYLMTLIQSDKVIYTSKPVISVNRCNELVESNFVSMNEKIMMYKAMATQAERIENVPDMFWYFLFESFQSMYASIASDSSMTKGNKEELLDYLETYLNKLVKHADVIRPLFKKNDKGTFLEKRRDGNLLNEEKYEEVFEGMKEKVLSE